MIREYAEKRIKDTIEVKEFAKWAFGENYLTLRGGKEFTEAWNNLHGDEQFFYETDELQESAYKMLDLWQQLQKT